MSMTAEELGRKLLAEVEECQLDQVLHSVKALLQHQQDHGSELSANAPSTSSSEGPNNASDRRVYPILGIPQLDALLLSDRTPNYSAHLQGQVPRSEREQEKELKPTVIELTETSPTGGVVHILYTAIAAAVLPPGPASRPGDQTANRTSLYNGGKSGIAIVLDAEGTFDVSLLSATMLSLLPRPTTPVATDNVPSDKRPSTPPAHLQTIEQALSHVHVFRPSSLAQVAATVAYLPTYLRSLHAPASAGHASYDRALALVVLDSASSFFWQERQAHAEAEAEANVAVLDPTTNSAETHSNPPKAAGKPSTAWDDLVSALRALQASFPSAAVLATAWPLTPATAPSSAATPARAAFRSHLPAAWSSLVIARLVMQREPVRKFPVGLSLAQCTREERESRAKVVSEGRFSVWRVGGKRAELRIDATGVHF